MAVTPINLARVSNNMRAYNLLESLRSNQLSLYRVQTSISTGLKFLQPSQDPMGAASAATLMRRLDTMSQIQTNLNKVNSTLNEADSAMQEALDLISQAQTMAIQVTGDTVSDDERTALIPVIDSLISQLVTVGNRQHLNTYLFSGHKGAAPFEQTADGVLYQGDAGRMETMIDVDGTQDSFTVSGQEFFGAVSSEMQGSVDLDPAVTAQTRISDLGGALDRGVQLGRILVTANGVQTEIDLRGAATVGDVIDKLNASLPGGVSATLDARGITLVRGAAVVGPVTVAEVGGGRTAADLGLLGTFDTPLRAGGDLNPRVTNLTQISDLRGGAGLDLSGGIVIRNGGQTATIQLDDAQTIEEVLNRINEADVGVWARLSADGCSLDVQSRISGADLQIEENGGNAATSLGLRSMYAGTNLSALNDGRGVETATGADFQITTASGTTIDIDLDGATTLQDVIDLLNTQGAGAITASFVSQGNGLQITDNTVGGGTLTIAALNYSPALSDLGLNVTAVGNRLVGQDVNPLRVDGPFTALIELREGMTSGSRQTLLTAGERLDRIVAQMQEIQGQMASRAKVMSDRSDLIETETTATEVMLSDVRDINIADAAVRLQQLQTALQANLCTAMTVMNLSLLDYMT